MYLQFVIFTFNIAHLPYPKSHTRLEAPPHMSPSLNVFQNISIPSKMGGFFYKKPFISLVC